MRRFQVPGSHLDTAAGFSAHERRRLIALTVGTLVVGLAILYGTYRSKRSGAGESSPIVPPPEFVESVAAPEVDRAALDALVRDEAADERVVLESEAVDRLLRLTRNLTPGQYRALGLQELDPAALAELTADPSAARGAPFLVRGWVDDVRSRNRGGREEHIIRLHLEASGPEGDPYAYVLVPNVHIALLDDVFVRSEGLFLKLFSDESDEVSGRWLEGPLFVSHELRHSAPSFGEVTTLDPETFEEVVDDELVSPLGMAPDPERSIPSGPLWKLMAYARDLPEDAIDWSQVEVLDDQALRALSEDGAGHRLQPYRIPLSRIQHATVLAAPENPARIRHYTEGWIGAAAWSNVIKFMAPFENREAELADYVEARGFFLKNFSYVSKDRGIRIAPFFVLESLQIRHPEPDPIFGKIIMAIFIGTLIAIAGFVILVIRDSRRSRALQEDIVRRRRERRRKRALQGQGT